MALGAYFSWMHIQFLYSVMDSNRHVWCDHLSFTFAAPKDEQFFSFRYFSIGRELFRNDLKTLVLKHVIQVFSNLAGLVKMSESGFQSVSLPPQLHLVLVSKS